MDRGRAFLRVGIGIALLCLVAACSSGNKPSAEPDIRLLAWPADDTIARIGRAIYEDDVVSARATDLLLPRVPKDAQLSGWVTTRQPDGWRVQFYARSEQGYVAHYRITFPAVPEVGKVAELTPPEPLDAQESSMVLARELADNQSFPRCTDRNYNAVILPAEMLGRSGWLVYMLAAHQRHGEVVLGGHARMHVSQDGRQLLETFALSKGCLVIPPASPAPDAIIVSTLVSPTPLETHVFLSLLHRKPVYVVVPRERTMFRVDPLGLARGS